MSIPLGGRSGADPQDETSLHAPGAPTPAGPSPAASPAPPPAAPRSAPARRSEEMAARGLPTPAHGHVGRGAFRDVYAPAEDTFLLLDALEAAAAELRRCEWAGPRGPAAGVPRRRPGARKGRRRGPPGGDPEAVTAPPGSRHRAPRKQGRGRRGPGVGTGAASAPRGLPGGLSAPAPPNPPPPRLSHATGKRGGADLPGSPAAPGPKQEVRLRDPDGRCWGCLVLTLTGHFSH